MEREVFSRETFHSVLEAQVVIDEWNELYNTRRPHRGLGGLTPAAFAKVARSQALQDRVRPEWWGCVRVPTTTATGPVLRRPSRACLGLGRPRGSHTKWTKPRGLDITYKER